MREMYEGEVCYVGHNHEAPDGRPLLGGWHYSVVDGMPGERLVLEDDGSYRLAEDGDSSHHDRHHKQYVQMVFEDGQESMQVTPEQLAQIKEILGQE